jgi:probable HAF family extracellular repeat protein
MERVSHLLMLFGAAVCLFAGSAAFGDQPSFTGLGDLPGGLYYSTAYRVSGDGSTAVGRSSSGSSYPDYEAFRWTEGTGINGLGYLEPTISHWSSAYGVSRDGSVVVGESTSGTLYWWASYWMENGTGATPLPIDGPYPGEVWSRAEDCSGNGLANGTVIVGGQSRPGSTDPSWKAYRWVWNDSGQNWNMYQLPPLGESSSMLARAVSADGSVVVGGPTGGDLGQQAFSWTQGDNRTVGLGDLPGGDFYSRALDVSADGSVIVGNAISTLGDEACRWSKNEQGDWVIQGLGDLEGGIFMSYANGVSGDGSIIVGGGRTGPTESDQEAFIWDEVYGMRNLRDVLVNEYHLDLTGWVLLGANGISADGLTIVGGGYNPNGDIEGFIAHIPEPGTLSLLVLGGVGILARRRGVRR